jgi:hypothetical protein
MTSEKLNNNNWKAKLEDVDALQEYALQNKNAAWESLHDQLHKKQKAKFVWYWMAAACLITAIAAVSVMHHPVNNNITIHAVVKTQPQQSSVEQQASQHSEIKRINATHVIVKMKSININLHKPIQHDNDKNEIIIEDSNVSIHNELANIKVELPILKDSLAQIITIATAPKKMQILHANELDDDGSNINIVRSRIPSRKRFLNQDIYSDYTLSAPASGLSISKHKNSPSN